MQEKQSGPEIFILWIFISLYSFSSVSLYVCPKLLILAVEVIVLATIQNSSSSKVFWLRYWNVYNCCFLCLGATGWKFLAKLFACWRNNFVQNLILWAPLDFKESCRRKTSFLREMSVECSSLALSLWELIQWVPKFPVNKDLPNPGAQRSISPDYCQTEN